VQRIEAFGTSTSGQYWYSILLLQAFICSPALLQTLPHIFNQTKRTCPLYNTHTSRTPAMSQQTITQTPTIPITRMKPPPLGHQQKPKSPFFTSATTLILTLNLTLFLALYLSSLNATYYYTARTAGELECLLIHFPLTHSSSPYSPIQPIDFPDQEMGRILEKARRKNCRYPCYSTFGKWVGNKGIGHQGWESNGCEKINNFCKAPLVKGRVGLDVVVWEWVSESLDRLIFCG
jgi:hypothetical protein